MDLVCYLVFVAPINGYFTMQSAVSVEAVVLAEEDAETHDNIFPWIR